MKSRRDKKNAEGRKTQLSGKRRSEDSGTNSASLTLLQEVATRQADIAQHVSDVNGRNALLTQQVGQLFDAVRQLYDAVGSQCRQLLQSDQGLRQELQQFQTGGPQRAMAGVFHRLFRHLTDYMGEMDEMLGHMQSSNPSDTDAAWVDSVRVLRDRYESLLKEWGCTCISAEPGQDFDPEVHQAVPAEPGDIPEAAEDHKIAKVRRRGWSLHGEVLSAPQVVVS